MEDIEKMQEWRGAEINKAKVRSEETFEHFAGPHVLQTNAPYMTSEE